MAKKVIKKYQGNTGSSSVRDPFTDIRNANVEAVNKAASENARNTNTSTTKQRYIDENYAKGKATADSTFKDALSVLKMERAKKQTEARNKILKDIEKSRIQKKGGTITSMDQVDKIYKSKYKK